MDALQQLHARAFASVQAGIECDESGRHDEADAHYSAGAAACQQALAMQIPGPEAAGLQQKMSRFLGLFRDRIEQAREQQRQSRDIQERARCVSPRSTPVPTVLLQ